MSQDPAKPLEGWTPRPWPTAGPIEGRYVRLEPLDRESHVADLYQGLAPAKRWRWLPIGMPDSRGAFAEWVGQQVARPDMEFYASVDRETHQALGFQALMRIEPDHGTIELGWVFWSLAMARTRLATETFALLAGYVFEELGYRRLEWKCDSQNEASRRAAERFGFQYEGTFRHDRVVKGWNRDTAWYSIVDWEWPRRAEAFRAWLDPANFDGQGAQIRALSKG